MEFGLPRLLSPIDNVMPTVFTPVLLLFPMARKNPQPAIDTIFKGFKQLLRVMPILTCSITEQSGGLQKGILAATLPRREASQLWKVQDLRGKEQTRYLKLRGEGFPISRFPVGDFTVLPFLFDIYPPAMHLQITLVDGGLVLAICVYHSLSDGTGFNVIARALATCCRGETIDPQQIVRMWTRPLILENQEKSPLEEFHEIIAHGKTQMMNMRPPSSGLELYLRRKLQAYYRPILKPLVFASAKFQALSCSTRMIHFPRSSSRKLKDIESNEKKISDGRDKLSTLDLLTALTFCCITESRLELKQRLYTSISTRKRSNIGVFFSSLLNWLSAIFFFKPKTSAPKLSEVTAPLLTAVNLRKACQPPVPADYIGNLFFICNIQTPLLQLLPTFDNISTLAHRLRARRKEMDDGFVRQVVSTIRSAPDVSKLDFYRGKFPELSLTMTSWREQDYCRLDWGSEVGVRCEAVRTCEYLINGLSIIFPESSMDEKDDGGLDVALSLEKDVMERLERNEFFNQFAHWR